MTNRIKSILHRHGVESEGDLTDEICEAVAEVVRDLVAAEYPLLTGEGSAPFCAVMIPRSPVDRNDLTPGVWLTIKVGEGDGVSVNHREVDLDALRIRGDEAIAASQFGGALLSALSADALRPLERAAREAIGRAEVLVMQAARDMLAKLDLRASPIRSCITMTRDWSFNFKVLEEMPAPSLTLQLAMTVMLDRHDGVVAVEMESEVDYEAPVLGFGIADTDALQRWMLQRAAGMAMQLMRSVVCEVRHGGDSESVCGEATVCGDTMTYRGGANIPLSDRPLTERMMRNEDAGE